MMNCTQNNNPVRESTFNINMLKMFIQNMNRIINRIIQRSNSVVKSKR